MDNNFIETFNAKCDAVHYTARSKGWWSNDRSVAECIALMHSELSELLECFRGNYSNENSDKIPEYSHAEEEIADLIIRAMDFSQYYGMDLGGAIDAKAEHNKTRRYMHGKLF